MSKKTKEMSTDQMLKMLGDARKRAGVNIGPPKPLSDEMLKKIQQSVDSDNRKKFAKGGSIDGCATRGKTKGRMV